MCGPFRREIAAVASGQAQFIRKAATGVETGAVYTLRRNVHRLEKGLIMRPRRPVFARDYLPATVSAYAGVLAQANASNIHAASLLGWASDVLETFFEAVESGQDDGIDRQRAEFARLRNGFEEPRSKRAPFVRPREPLAVTLDGLRELAIRRRSCRWYRPEPVPRAIIDAAVEVAGYSPSACNRQPFEFRVFDRPEEAAEVGAIPMGTRGFSENFPCFVAIVGSLAAFPHERDRHVIYVDASLAAMAFQLALEVQGIGSCCINWPDIPGQEKAMAQRLGLEPWQRVVMCLSLGYPDPQGQVPYSQKKPVSELRRYESR